MRSAVPFAVLLLAAATSGCGENCQSTCRHVFAASECNIQPGGLTPESLISDCVSECSFALRNSGELDGYDPYSKHPPTDGQPKLETDQQAAAWIDCVWSKAPLEGYSSGCEQLEPANGFCAPTTF